MTLIESLSGVAPRSALAGALSTRAEVMRLSQAAHDAVLLPRDAGGLPHALRAALAARMARLNDHEPLARHYDALLPPDATPTTAALARPGTDAADPRTAEIVRHADRLTVEPRAATRAHVEALKAAGVAEPDIVRLAELAAFVGYQVRVIAGLTLLAGLR